MRGFRIRNDRNDNVATKTKEESFYRLLQNTSLILDDKGNPITFKGEEMTVQKLMQDIATFAFLTNDKNTVFDFRNIIPNKYLKLIGYNENIRLFYEDLMSDNIPTDMLDNFVDQFFQNNPNLIDFGNISYNEDDNTIDFSDKIGRAHV